MSFVGKTGEGTGYVWNFSTGHKRGDDLKKMDGKGKIMCRTPSTRRRPKPMCCVDR